MPGATGFCDCSSVRAHQGTLFLDEVGDIPFELQPKPLRVLQEKEFERLGGTQTQQVNVRVVAATSRDLPQMVAERQFRNDLYYRLNVFPVRLPPLRERAEDIPLLVSHFVNKFANQMNKQVETVPPEVVDFLSRYHWPGSVRELENLMERSVILSSAKSSMRPWRNWSLFTAAPFLHHGRLGQGHHTRRMLAQAHPAHAQRNPLDRRRTERRGNATGREAHHAYLENAKTRHLPQCEAVS